MGNNKIIQKISSFILIIIIWQVIANRVGKALIFPTPFESLKALIIILTEKVLLKSIYYSCLRVIMAFFIACFFGIGIGFLMYFFPKSKVLFYPILRIIQTSPVMSFIMLALLWIRTDYVPIFIGFLMGLPIIASSSLKGLNSIDDKLVKMSNFFQVGLGKRIKFLYIPSMFPFLEVGIRNALSLTWKVSVAAEVLAYPKHGLGAKLLDAKTLLETDGLFAWTFIIIMLGMGSEYIVKSILSRTRIGKYYDSLPKGGIKND